MKVTIIGTHGIPAKYGGFETFAAHLAEALAKEGISVSVINEKKNPVGPVLEGIEIISSAFNKSESPLRFYKESLKIAVADSDVIISCGVGGAYSYRQYRNIKAKIITNVDGLEHRRSKYTGFQRLIVYHLQKLVTKYSDIIIADSLEIKKYWTGRFPHSTYKIKTIAYGADKCLPMDLKVLEECNLVSNEYFLVIARLVPENKLLEIIQAFKSYIGSKKLVVVGGLENTAYVRKLELAANDNVLFTDSVYDKSFLDSLRQGCFLYLHGHSVGGTNPALLEAMAAGCAIMCHDNVFNREVTGKSQIYFHSQSDLAIMLNLLEHKASDVDVLKKKSIERVQNEYNWKKICSAYIQLINVLYLETKNNS